MKQDYREMVEFVAENDDPTNLNIEEISISPSVEMLSFLFKIPTEVIAEEIVSARSYIVCTSQYYNVKKKQRKPRAA